MSKTVGSNFFLRDKVVNVEFKSVCWQALAASAGAAAPGGAQVNLSNLLALVDYVGTFYLTPL
jgi:hypothetical protein